MLKVFNKYCLVIILVFSIVFVNAQSSYGISYNPALLGLVGANSTARMVSEKQYYNSFKKQREIYDKANEKMTQIVLISEHIHKILTDVDETVRQGHQLKTLLSYFGRIQSLGQEMIKESFKNPQYTALCFSYYEYIIKELNKIRIDLQNVIIGEDSLFQMDTFDRTILLEKQIMRCRIIEGNILHITNKLKWAKKIPYLHQIPGLGNYIILDKAIAEHIVSKYKNLKQW